MDEIIPVFLFFPWPKPYSILGRLIVEVYRSHMIRHTPHGRTAVDECRPVAGVSTWQHITLTTCRQPCTRQDSNPQSRQVSGRRPTP